MAEVGEETLRAAAQLIEEGFTVLRMKIVPQCREQARRVNGAIFEIKKEIPIHLCG